MNPRSRLLRLSVPAILLTCAPAWSSTPEPPGAKAACCQLTTSLASEALRGQDITGDERFFMSEGTPPNVHFLIDTSASMRELPQVDEGNHEAFFAAGDGCSNPDLLAMQAANGWDPSVAYPVPDADHPGLFKDDKFYAYMFWEDLNAPTAQWNTKEEVCAYQHPASADPTRALYNTCLSCMQTKGFYKRPGATGSRPGTDPRRYTFAFSGRFLNFNPPKYVTAKTVLKSILRDMRQVRVGISYFDADNSAHGALMSMPQGPSCTQLGTDPRAFATVRANYLAAVDALRFKAATPLAESLLNLGQYFSSSDSIYTSLFGFDGSFLKGGFQNMSLSLPERSWCWGCQSTSIVIVTDGEPSADEHLPAASIEALNGGPVACPSSEPCPEDALHKLDDVAKLLATQDLQQSSPAVVGDFDTNGRQSLTVHAIGFGINANILKNAARVGGGLYYQANDGAGLKQALEDIIANVNRRSTSFSAASTSGSQLGSASGTLVPRLRPGRDKQEPWRGYLYRYKLASELLLGCKPSLATAGGDPWDLNHDKDCEDVHLIDMDGDAVVENEVGDFVKVRDRLLPTKPFWEAGQKLKPTSAPTQRWKTRDIYTLVDNGGPSGGPDGMLDSHDTPVAFTEANAPLLREALGISASGCTVAGDKLSPDDCARAVIRYYRGADVLNTDTTRRDFDRPFLLHDIFHSAPQSVEPPMPREFCGFSPQCLQTLYDGRTPQQSYTSTSSGRTHDAYDEYVARHEQRDRVVLVGSNGGMLHAIHNGSRTGKDPLTGLPQYDEGTGEELWAFVPPDLLPKLLPKLGQHGWFVDGTPMVREVWLDGVGKAGDAAADGKKQASEFRTVTVVGSGTGGVHRFALDVTALLASPGVGQPGRAPNQKGDFLWMWPQPCDALALQLGESDGHFAPRPPPIGPVAMADPAGPWRVAGTQAREAWVVILNGGYDRSLNRGRGLAMVDMKTGETLWSFFHGDGSARSEHLRNPFAASVAMMDIGGELSSKPDGDLLFDTATVADYGGQVWTVRFWQPGERPAAGGPVNNWFAARAFQVKGSGPNAVRPAFSYMTSNTVQPDTGYLRTFVGTGDRYNLAESGGTTCRLSNPLGCAQLGCRASQTVTVERGGSTAWSTRTTYDNYTNTSTVPTAPGAAGAVCGATKVSLDWDYGSANGCSASVSGRLEYTCDGTGCRVSRDDWMPVAATKPLPATSAHRFYGFWSYGVKKARTFDTAASATTYESGLLTEDRLVDVSQFASDGRVTSGAREAGSLEAGWYVSYHAPREQTGSGTAIVNGCVLWNSFEPGTAGGLCAASGGHSARVYQADFVGGTASCAEGFSAVAGSGSRSWKRFEQRDVVAAPADPVPQRGLETVDILLNEPGTGPRRVGVSLENEALQSLYQLELDRSGHDCRHEAQRCE
ncbi:pilus assembly protein PilY [Archangium lansingense]|uniref:Pilus assembly protein PilY n=1 Tax=Archangium lansingense TaxID=2995310 RepID=A0ABT4AKC6_9BACT|nr:pilus assembly protein PilY [Archangium lansinium]MCY1082156.1 pilus assembly protein PilY [Archangium lansinium]